MLEFPRYIGLKFIQPEEIVKQINSVENVEGAFADMNQKMEFLCQNTEESSLVRLLNSQLMLHVAISCDRQDLMFHKAGEFIKSIVSKRNVEKLSRPEITQEIFRLNNERQNGNLNEAYD